MTVKFQRPISIWNPRQCLVDLEELKRAMLWYIEKYVGKPVIRIKTIFFYGRYPAISIYGKKIHVHRLLMMYWVGRELLRDEYVHHNDKDRFNCRKENLVLMRAGGHQSLHLTGRKQSVHHVQSRINATCLTRYGHGWAYENPELLEEK